MIALQMIEVVGVTPRLVGMRVPSLPFESWDGCQHWVEEEARRFDVAFQVSFAVTWSDGTSLRESVRAFPDRRLGRGRSWLRTNILVAASYRWMTRGDERCLACARDYLGVDLRGETA